MRKKKKQLQFSKILCLITGATFIATLLYVFFGKSDYNSYSSPLITAVTVSGGLFSSCVIFYMRKSQAENISAIRTNHIKTVAEIEYKYYEKKLRLRKELNLTDNDIMEVENSTMLDERLTEAEEEDNSYLKDKFDEASENIDSQTF